MSELELVIQTGDDLIVEEDVFELVFSGAPGPPGPAGSTGPGFDAGGTTDQLIKKASNDDFDFEYFTLTKDFIGLENVTDDAQLKRSANDFATFTEKVTPVITDLLLIEDSEAAGVKKKIQVGNLPSDGGGGILELQSTAILSNDTFIEFALVAGKPNVFIFEQVNTTSAYDLFSRLSIDNGVSYIDAVTTYKWVNSIIYSNISSDDISGNNSSNTFVIKSPRHAVSRLDGIFETSPPIDGKQLVLMGEAYFMYVSGYPAKTRFVGSNNTTSLVTNIRFSANRVASKMVSGKIHHYIKNLG